MNKTYWIVRNNWTDIPSSFSYHRKTSISEFCKYFGFKRNEWEKLRKEGWRCEKVELKKAD